MGQGPGNPRVVHNQEGFAPEDYEAAAAKELVLQRDSGTMARAVDLQVLGVLPSSDWVGLHAPEPVTSSLRPSVLLNTHGDGVVLNADCICHLGTL